MLNKSKLNLSVILLVIGIGLLPTGLFFKGYFSDQVSAEVVNVLTAVEEDIVQKIEDQYLGLGIYKVLPGIHDDKIGEIEDEFAEIFGIPKTLLFIQNRTTGLFPQFFNCTKAAVAINETLWNVVLYNSTSPVIARNLFFNNYTFQDNFSMSIEGISEHMTGGIDSLNFTGAAISRLLNGRTIGETNYPGLINELAYGAQVTAWLDFYSLAEADIGTNRSLMKSVYNCTWLQLKNVSEYITSYLWEDIFKLEYSPPYTIEEYAEILFYRQWVNASWLFTGINLGYIPEVEVNLFGWEVGRLDPINISINTAKKLWDPLNESTFVNDIGVWKWIYAAGGNSTLEDELKSVFGLSNVSIAEIFTWLTGPIKNTHVSWIFSLPAPIGVDMSIREYAEILYLEQWANGTIKSEGLDFDYSVSPIVRPDGDAGALWADPATGSHYENINDLVAQPTEGTDDYIATQNGDAGLTETFDMETIILPSTGTVTQIEVWIYGHDDDDINDMTVDINMNGWQGAQNVTMTNQSAWYSKIFPIAAANGTNAHLDALQVRFTAGANVNQFLNYNISTMYARVTFVVTVRGLEAGIPIKTNITLNTASDLLNPSNSSSFIDRFGILKWIDAYEGNVTAQTEIMTTFSLNIQQLNLINNWLFTTFRYIMVPELAWILTSTHLPTFAQMEFYHQWADAKIFKGGIDAGPLLGLNSLSEWEIGLPVKTYIDETICSDLWGHISIIDPLRTTKLSNSLVNWKGISNWFRAMRQVEYYNYLQNLFSLSDDQMDAILAWLIEIRENFAIPIAQMRFNLPVDHYTFGSNLLFGFTISGIIIGGIGILGVILIVISKRR